jgi:curved DNA-binding protein
MSARRGLGWMSILPGGSRYSSSNPRKIINLGNAAADVTDMADFYQRLDISQEASPDEIRKVFRKLARQCHPDFNPGDKAAEKRFVEINEAHETLSDPEKRQRYDELLRLGVFDSRTSGASRPERSGSQGYDPRVFQQGGQAFQMGNFSDILSNLSGAMA